MRFLLSTAALITAMFVLVTIAPPAVAAEFGEKCVVGEGSCGDVMWCNPEPGTCEVTEVRYGKCDGVPRICAQIYAPVCGCDGKTYSNGCDLRGAKMAADYVGQCKPEELEAPKEAEKITPR